MLTSAFILLSLQLSSLGGCSNPIFSVCWVRNVNASAKRPDIKVWLDNTELTPIGSPGKLTSLPVTPLDVHKLRTEYAGISRVWNFSIASGSINVSGEQMAAHLPASGSVEALETLQPDEVFPCENETRCLYREEHLIVVLGHTLRFPLKAESPSPSTLLVTWTESPSPPPDPPQHRVTLYGPAPDGLALLCNDTTRLSHFRFVGLDGCRRYVACVGRERGGSVLCLSELTGPDEPEGFRVTGGDSSSLTVSWDWPPAGRLTSFLVTVFHLSGSDRLLEERSYRQAPDARGLTVGPLPPCSRVRLGLQAVCQDQGQTHHSRMTLSDGNSANSEIVNLRQSSSGPYSYTVRWSVRNVSSISSFRVYHQGELQRSTLLTAHTVGGLEPCGRYSSRVEGLCGDSTVMSSASVLARTGPGEVQDLCVRQEDSVAVWSGSSGGGVAYSYRLSESGGPVVREGRVAAPPLPLRGLRPGAPHVLEVAPECDGGAERGPAAVLRFVAEDLSGQAPGNPSRDRSSGAANDLIPRGAAETHPTTGPRGLWGPLAGHEMFLVLPWRMPPSLQDPATEPRVLLEGIIKHKLQSLLRESWPDAEVRLVSFEGYEKNTKTKVTFQNFVSGAAGPVSLRPEEQLRGVASLRHPNVTVTDGVLHWHDPDECADSALNACGPQSLCVNTLDSFTCVCEPGYYDLAPFLSPACHERGMFTRCRKGDISGGVSKSFLLRYFGGDVTAILNDGRCSVNETDKLYYFRLTSAPTLCGGQTLLNQTHVSLRNALTVTPRSRSSITRRDLRVLWTCTYPLLHTATAHARPGPAWFSSHSLVRVNSSRFLEVGMALFSDASYAHAHAGPVEVPPSERLYVQVALLPGDGLALDANASLLLEACWATETADPQEERKGFLLQEGCPKDRTFQWHLHDGSHQRRRFSVQMFTMSDHTHVYLHCLARICSRNQDCATNCRDSRKMRRDLPDTLTAIVSAGPISAGTGKRSNWTAVQIMLSVGGVLISLFVLTALGVRAAQVIAQRSHGHQ